MNPDLPTVPYEPVGSRGRIAPPYPWFYGSVGWCLSLILVMIVAMLAFAAVDIFIHYSDDPNLWEKLRAEADLNQRTGKLGPILSRAMGLGFVGAGVVSLLYTLLIVRLRIGSEWPRKLAVRLPRFDHLIFALIGLPALMVLHGGAHHLANQLFRVDPKDADMTNMLLSIVEPWPRWLTILVIGVAPGIGEELWCRGFLGRGLIGRYGWYGGVLLTSLLFGMLHLSPPYALGTAAMGVCLHFTYLTTRSILVPILLHTLNNSFTMLIALKEIDLGDPDAVASPMMYLTASFLAFAVGLVLFQSRGRLVDAAGAPVATPFPTVGLPTSESGHRIVHAKPTWWAVGLVGIAAAVFGWVVAGEM